MKAIKQHVTLCTASNGVPRAPSADASPHIRKLCQGIDLRSSNEDLSPPRENTSEVMGSEENRRIINAFFSRDLTKMEVCGIMGK